MRRYDDTKRRGLVRHVLVWAGLALVGGVCVAVASAMVLIRVAPPWWRPVRVDDPATIETAKVVQNRLLNAAHQPWEAGEAARASPSRDWSVALEPFEANAWLNVELPKWLAHQGQGELWPRQMSELQVDFRASTVRLGARVRTAGGQRIVTATVRPELRRDGSLWVEAEQVSVGRLALPSRWALERVRRWEGGWRSGAIGTLPEADHVLDALAGARPLADVAQLRLEDGRLVRLVGIEARGGRLELRCRTLAR